jgi:hypothetical protein
MSGGGSSSGGARRREQLRFKSEDDVVADVNRLRRGYARAGAWSLPQVCCHLDKSMQYRMRPGPFESTTPEQAARGDQLQQILTSGRLPDGQAAPDFMTPPPDCGDAAIDAFLARLEQFKNFPGPIAPHRLFGHLSDADARRINLIHCAHHLSYLTPTAAT